MYQWMNRSHGSGLSGRDPRETGSSRTDFPSFRQLITPCHSVQLRGDEGVVAAWTTRYFRSSEDDVPGEPGIRAAAFGPSPRVEENQTEGIMRGGRSSGRAVRAGCGRSKAEQRASDGGAGGRRSSGTWPQSSTRSGTESGAVIGISGNWEHAPPAQGDRRRDSLGIPGSEVNS